MNAYGSGSASRLSEAEQFDQLSRQIETYRGSRIIITICDRRDRLPVEVLLRFMVERTDRDDNRQAGGKGRWPIYACQGRTGTYKVHVALGGY